MFPERYWVSIWSFNDWNSLLSFRWSAAHHPGQHRAGSCLWENPVQVLQVCCCDALPDMLLGWWAVCTCVLIKRGCSLPHSCLFWCVPAFLSGSTASPTSPWGPASACGRPSSVSCWWPQTPARWCVTSLASPRKLSPPWSASSSSTRRWRSWSTWVSTTPSTNTTTYRHLRSTREYFFASLKYLNPLAIFTHLATEQLS